MVLTGHVVFGDVWNWEFKKWRAVKQEVAKQSGFELVDVCVHQLAVPC